MADFFSFFFLLFFSLFLYFLTLFFFFSLFLKITPTRVIKLSDELNAACQHAKQTSNSSTVVSRINGATSIQCKGLEVSVPLSDDSGEGKKPSSVLPLISNLTTEMNAGEHTVVVGPNGTGKTSLFRTLGGVWSPSSGSVRNFSLLWTIFISSFDRPLTLLFLISSTLR